MKEKELNSPRNPYLVTAEQMRAFDFAAINEFAIPGVVLMENAGRASFEILKGVLDDDLDGLYVSIVAGPGNNGGDGYVIARYLINNGADV
jgi:NAD(P)H-hydrate epimerase